MERLFVQEVLLVSLQRGTQQQKCSAKFFHDFNHHRLSGRALLFLDCHQAHIEPFVLIEEENEISSYSFFPLTAAMSSIHWTKFFSILRNVI
jgi:hypothetical protein